MDPAGLTLENYDGVGGWRTMENGAPIDASGSLDWLEFQDPAGLAQALHDNPEPPRYLVERLYPSSCGRHTEMSVRPYMDHLIKHSRDRKSVVSGQQVSVRERIGG